MFLKHHFKLFIVISLTLHFLIMGLFFISWEKKDGEWQGGGSSSGIVTISLFSSPLSPMLSKPPPSNFPQGLPSVALPPGEGELKEGLGYDANGNTSPDILAKIRQKILQAKQYPLVAKRQGLEGRVQVLFALTTSGDIQELSVVESSGVPLLDQEALATVKRASPYPYYSEDIIVSLKFELTE